MQQKIEGPIVLGGGRQRVQCSVRIHIAACEVSDKIATRVSFDRLRVTHIGHRRHPAPTQRNPSAAMQEIATTDDTALAFPCGQWKRWPFVELVAIGGNHQRIPGVNAPSERDQTHSVKNSMALK